ncbi:M48 family metallopeptidase [Clostridium sp. LP20]|uniref:M48 family metallopeptidase n=1 Tax=Clostridium sp. LP20 TaxID=3418665 RepID=UPI003EE71061
MIKEFEYQIKYKKRKTLSISVELDGVVQVVAPIGLPKGKIEEVLKSKESWILKRIKEVESKEKLNVDEVMYLGQIYKVKVLVQRFSKVDFVVFHEGVFLVNVRDENNVIKALESWFREMTEKTIKDKVQKYKHYFIERPKEIIIKEQKRRWGSCSYDNKLLFNWRLSMATEDALEYVVVHEMCHMVHKNHSTEYWREVERVLPNYKESHNWLKEKGYLLNLQ